MEGKIASSGTIEGLEKLLNQYFYSTTFKVNSESLEVSNKNGVLPHLKVIYKKGRYTALNR